MYLNILCFRGIEILFMCSQRDNNQELTDPCKLYVCKGFSLPKNGICREFGVNHFSSGIVLCQTKAHIDNKIFYEKINDYLRNM